MKYLSLAVMCQSCRKSLGWKDNNGNSMDPIYCYDCAPQARREMETRDRVLEEYRKQARTTR